MQSQPQATVLTPMRVMDDEIIRQRASPRAIGLILAVTIISFTVQTEATAYYQEVLGWPKPFASLYLTHSCLALPWLFYQLLLKPGNKRSRDLWRTNLEDVADHAMSTDAYQAEAVKDVHRPASAATALIFLLRTMAIVTVTLTVSGISWFGALSMTTPSDLTVIYNCSAFFAAVFSVPLLGDRLTRNIIVAVGLSFIGTLMIAYGSGSDKPGLDAQATEVGSGRVLGNSVAVVGACAYGLYCVLFKKWTISAQRSDPTSSLELTLAGSGLTGLYTFCFGWLALLVLHFTGVELLQLPSLQVLPYLIISVLPGAVGMTFVLVLTCWTTPVFGSVASVLCVFFVAIADWILYGITPTLATYAGGTLIFVAFALLSWDQSTS